MNNLKNTLPQAQLDEFEESSGAHLQVPREIDLHLDRPLRSCGDVYDELNLVTGELIIRIGDDGRVLDTPIVEFIQPSGIDLSNETYSLMPHGPMGWAMQNKVIVTLDITTPQLIADLATRVVMLEMQTMGNNGRSSAPITMPMNAPAPRRMSMNSPVAMSAPAPMSMPVAEIKMEAPEEPEEAVAEIKMEESEETVAEPIKIEEVIYMNEYLKRFANTGTIMSIISIIGLILIQFGVDVDMVWLENTIKLVCSLGVVLGVLNNPTTPGVDIPKKLTNEIE